MKQKYVYDWGYDCWWRADALRNDVKLGQKWYKEGWHQCWVEPEVNEPNCWYPQAAGQFMMAG